MFSNGHAPVNFNSALNDLKTNKVALYQMSGIDDVKQSSSLSIGYLMTSDAIGYIVFNIMWIVVEFKIANGGAIYVRGKYGNSAFTSWKQIN